MKLISKFPNRSKLGFAVSKDRSILTFEDQGWHFFEFFPDKNQVSPLPTSFGGKAFPSRLRVADVGETFKYKSTKYVRQEAPDLENVDVLEPFSLTIYHGRTRPFRIQTTTPVEVLQNDGVFVFSISEPHKRFYRVAKTNRSVGVIITSPRSVKRVCSSKVREVLSPFYDDVDNIVLTDGHIHADWFPALDMVAPVCDRTLEFPELVGHLENLVKRLRNAA